MGRYLLRCVRLLLLVPALFVGIGLVIAAIFFLVSFVPSPYLGMRATSEARVKAAESQMQSFQQAIEAYAADNGMPPTSQQGLDALVSEPTDPPRPRKRTKYLPDVNSVPKDPWGDDYVYRNGTPNGNSFVITSYGAHGRPGGAGYDADLTIRGSAFGKQAAR